jgi:hypothetical protein
MLKGYAAGGYLDDSPSADEWPNTRSKDEAELCSDGNE